MTDTRTDEELAAAVRADLVDRGGAIALAELTRRLSERTEEVARLRDVLEADDGLLLPMMRTMAEGIFGNLDFATRISLTSGLAMHDRLVAALTPKEES